MRIVYLHYDRGCIPLHEPSDDQVTLLVHFYLQVSPSVRLQIREVKPGCTLRDIVRENWQGMKREPKSGDPNKIFPLPAYPARRTNLKLARTR